MTALRETAERLAREMRDTGCYWDPESLERLWGDDECVRRHGANAADILTALRSQRIAGMREAAEVARAHAAEANEEARQYDRESRDVPAMLARGARNGAALVASEIESKAKELEK